MILLTANVLLSLATMKMGDIVLLLGQTLLLLNKNKMFSFDLIFTFGSPYKGVTQMTDDGVFTADIIDV